MDQSNAILPETQSEDSGGVERLPENPSSVWGRLVPLNTCSLLTLQGAEVVVGRAMISAEDVTLSKEHFKLKLGSDGVVVLENLSQHGTYVQDKLISDGDVTLKKNDCIKLGTKPNSPSYVFVPCETTLLAGIATDTASAQGDPQVQTTAEKSIAAGDGEAKDVPQKRKASLDALEEELRCGLCSDLFCDAITLSCGHNYCNACFSDWYRMKTEREHTVCCCPECRRPVRSASRCHRLTRMVEAYLKTHAELQRSPRTATDMAKRAIVTGEPMMIDKRSGGGGLGDDSDEEEEEDADASGSDNDGADEAPGVGTRCKQCPPRGGGQPAVPAAPGEFQCPDTGPHLRCSACMLLLPDRDPAPAAVTCSGCRRVYCDAYWRSQAAAATDPNYRPPPLCQSGQSLLKLNQHAMGGLPGRAHAGSHVEQEITARALRVADISTADAVTQSIAKVESGEWGGQLHWVWPNPGAANIVAPADLHSMFCTSCATAVNSQLFDRYRMAMQPEDLPLDARCKENCWYGLGCWTQHKNPDHARRLNHVCVAKRTGGPSGRS